MPHHRVVGGGLGVAQSVGVEDASGARSGLRGDLIHGAAVLDALEEDSLHPLAPDDADDLFDVLRGGLLTGGDHLHRQRAIELEPQRPPSRLVLRQRAVELGSNPEKAAEFSALKEQLKDARLQTQKLIQAAEQESDKLYREAIGLAQAESNASREAARREIDGQRTAALSQIRGDSDKLATQIVDRLLAAS